MDIQYHFHPRSGWMNDPNGTICIDGKYHLFYQYYPDDIVWGPMHWGHAVSEDLLHWEHLPVAIHPTEDAWIFSGSCVLDRRNLSGLGSQDQPALLAFYTAHHPQTGEQQQCLAYSTDGVSFVPFAGNPILPNRMGTEAFRKDYRDPKVFALHDGSYAMVLSGGEEVLFYHSENLLQWTLTGSFNPAEHGISGICECPDCFPLTLDGREHWVLTISMVITDETERWLKADETTPANRHVVQYFIGRFADGIFTPEEDQNDPLLLDYGPDQYASVTFTDSPEPLMIGWGENWETVYKQAPGVYRGKMSLPRRLRLVSTARGLRLASLPVSESITERLTLLPGESRSLTTTIGSEVTIAVAEGLITVTRSTAAGEGYDIIRAPRFMQGACDMQIAEDCGYIELFADQGLTVVSLNSI